MAEKKKQETNNRELLLALLKSPVIAIIVAGIVILILHFITSPYYNCRYEVYTEDSYNSRTLCLHSTKNKLFW